MLAVPSRGATAMVAESVIAPHSPPSHAHHGRAARPEVRGPARVITTAASAKAAVSITPEMAAAQTGEPTTRASRALIAACAGSMAPARYASGQGRRLGLLREGGGTRRVLVVRQAAWARSEPVWLAFQLLPPT